MFLLIAMLVISVALYAFVYMTGPAAAWIISGCALYVIGVFIVTVVVTCHEPAA